MAADNAARQWRVLLQLRQLAVIECNATRSYSSNTLTLYSVGLKISSQTSDARAPANVLRNVRF